MEATWFAGRLRELRADAGLTQKQLAEKAGLTRIGVAQIEGGTRSPSWDTVIALCKALTVDPGEFAKRPSLKKKPRPGRPFKPNESSAE
jgi:transcriptional regulator with XRE-family HTH domain